MKQSKLDHVTVNQEYNNQVPKGAIAKQSVNPDSYVRINDHQITLTESLGVKRYMLKIMKIKIIKLQKELEKWSESTNDDRIKNNVKKIILFHKALKIQRLKREVQFNSLFQKENIFKDEDKDSEKSKSSSEDKSDDTQKVKNYTETYHIPYTGDDESQKFKFTLEIRTIVAHLLAKRLV